jgi:hypothetical protein
MMFSFEMDTPDAEDLRGTFALRRYAYPNATNNNVWSPPGMMYAYIGEWAHLAATFDGTTGRLYLNSREVASGPLAFSKKKDASMAIGNNNGATGWPNCPGVFNGDMDEARIYNRDLSPTEIAYLADATPADGELYTPLPSLAELYDAEPKGSRVVNFKDFAILADNWLEEDLWP